MSEPAPERPEVDVLMVGAALAITLHEIADALDRLADALTEEKP